MSEIEIRQIETVAEMETAFAIRRTVFCEEQGVDVALEIDGHDPDCRHFLIRRGGVPIGTARVRPVDADTVKIERVAVLADWRGLGFGRMLMKAIMESVDPARTKLMILNAQVQTEAFYAALGFRAEGAPFDEAGIPHVRMGRET